MKENEVKEAEEKAVEEEKEVEPVESVERVAEEPEKEEEKTTPADLIRQQALQAEYIEKMNALLNKDEVTQEDIQTVEYVKSEVLGQLLGVAAFSAALDRGDPQIKAADALSTHLTKMYSKTALLREKMERKRLAHLEKMDVADALLGSNKQQTMSDDFLISNLRRLRLDAGKVSPEMLGLLALTDLENNPEKRLTAMMPDLLNEYRSKTTETEQADLSNWVSTLVSGLSDLKNKGAMLNALEGVNMIQTLNRVNGVNNLMK